MSKKHYAVKNGRKPGIYSTWDEAKAQVDGFSGAIYKSFKSLEDAKNFMGNAVNQKSEAAKPVMSQIEMDAETIIAYVDGSYDKGSEMFSFGVVIVQNGKVLTTIQRAVYHEVYKDSWQIGGELMGSLVATEWAIEAGYKKIIIHYDYLGIEKWASGEWKAKKPAPKDYVMKFGELKKRINVEFVKVKAHTGVLYNEMADELAKEAIKLALEDASTPSL